MKSKWTRRVLCREGKPIVVLRYADPLSLVNAAKRALNTQDQAELELAVAGKQATFVGWLSHEDEGGLIDHEGNDCGVLAPGDHLVTFDTPAEMHAAVERVKNAEHLP